MITGDEAPVETEPAAAALVFGDRLPIVQRFAADLVEHGEPLGLIGPRETARIWSRHVVNCGLLAAVIPAGASVADVGSGAGLPGLVLAAARPDLRLTLIEPMERRVDWLESESQRLGVGVTVRRARAEEVGERFDVVTARAVGALTALLPITAPLVVPGGELLLLKGASVDAEITKARPVLARLRLVDPRVEMLGAGVDAEGTRIFRATVP